MFLFDQINESEYESSNNNIYIRPFVEYERMYLPLYNVVDTTFRSQADVITLW